MKKIKENIMLIVISFIMGGIILGTGVYAANEILFSSSQVSFDNTRANLKNTHGDPVETVEEAIDALKARGACEAGYEEVNLGNAVICRNTHAPICKRAATLHTEICNQGENTDSYYCHYDGYYVGGTRNTTTVTYGRLGISGQPPQIGDAFDCDINGDGLYDSTTERFYYVSDYFDTNTSSFDNTRAALIYYKNTVNGVPDDGGVAYYGTSSAYDNWHGPTVAITHLPSTTGNNAWRDDLLKTDNRKIQACSDNNCTTLSDSTTGGAIVQTEHIYSGKAARLIHLKEIKKGCATDLSQNTSLSNECNFLMENTKYTNASKPTYGPWIENPRSANATGAWVVTGGSRKVVDNSNYANRGARPAIDIPYSEIAY